MPSKSRRAAHGHTTYRSRKVARREPSTSTVTDQAARMAVPVQVKKESALDVQSEDKRRRVMTTDWRRTLILGGILLIALVVVSLILRYNFTV